MNKTRYEVSMDVWPRMYKASWQKIVVVEAFSHPAKYSRALIQHIYQHAMEEGWLVPGNTVLDVFAGTALGAYDAMTHGMRFVGIELEQPFTDIGSGCDCTGISKTDWVRFYGRWQRMRYAEDRYWCPQCLREAGRDTTQQRYVYGLGQLRARCPHQRQQGDLCDAPHQSPERGRFRPRGPIAMRAIWSCGHVRGIRGLPSSGGIVANL